MSYVFYKGLHSSALFLLIFALGGLWILSAGKSSFRGHLRSRLLIFHGIAWFAAFIAGFGLIAKLKIGFPWPLWIYFKLLVGIALGAAPLFLRKFLSDFQPAKSGRVWIAFFLLLFLILSAVISVHGKIGS